MSVNTTENTVNLHLTVATAEALAALLANVSDVTAGEGLDSLYSDLLDAGLSDSVHNVVVEANPLFDEDDFADEPEFNIVVED